MILASTGMDIHNVKSIKVRRFTPKNANAITISIDHGVRIASKEDFEIQVDIVLFGLSYEYAKAIKDAIDSVNQNIQVTDETEKAEV